jgi:hypothetical protein
MAQFDAQDWLLLEAGASELQDYLLSDELFWPVQAIPHAADTQELRLTNGNLLLSIARLGVVELSPQDRQRYETFAVTCEKTRTQWRVKWQKKSQREFQSRFRTWRNFLTELISSMVGGSSNQDETSILQQQYVSQVRLRVILQLLVEDTPQLEGEEDLLTDLDKRMQTLMVRGQFLWDEVYRQRFPEQTYWFLYSGLR